MYIPKNQINVFSFPSQLLIAFHKHIIFEGILAISPLGNIAAPIRSSTLVALSGWHKIVWWCRANRTCRSFRSVIRSGHWRSWAFSGHRRWRRRRRNWATRRRRRTAGWWLTSYRSLTGWILEASFLDTHKSKFRKQCSYFGWWIAVPFTRMDQSCSIID